MQLKSFNHIVTALSPVYLEYEIELNTPSDFSKENLYFFYLVHTLNAQFPFYIECKPFDAYLLLYTEEGEGLLTYNDQTYLLEPDTILFIDCKTSFRLEINKSNSWKSNLLLVNGGHIKAYYDYFISDDFYVGHVTPASNITQIFSKLLQLSIVHTITNDCIISKLITDLLTELILIKEANQNHLTNLPKYLVQIKELFDSNYAQHFNLDELAQTYHVSKYKIIRDFSLYFHSSPINYLIDKRITAAKKLLLETDYPICEIALMVGIDNINHFTNLFKKSTHLTPNHYRKSCQIEYTKYLDS